MNEVKSVNGMKLGLSGKILPRGDIFEITNMSQELLNQLKREIIIDTAIIKRLKYYSIVRLEN